MAEFEFAGVVDGRRKVRVPVPFVERDLLGERVNLLIMSCRGNTGGEKSRELAVSRSGSSIAWGKTRFREEGYREAPGVIFPVILLTAPEKKKKKKKDQAKEENGHGKNN
jgi:hypothetical protein